MGNYFTFFWRCGIKSDITVRLEYRQENLGSYVQGQGSGLHRGEGNYEN